MEVERQERLAPAPAPAIQMAAHDHTSPPPSPPAESSTRRGQLKVAPKWLDSIMAVVYPASLGLQEVVTQVGMKTLMALLDCCLFSTWSMPHPCGKEKNFYMVLVILVTAIVATVLWLKIVYTRYETTTAMPIEYGTLHLGVIIGGIVFFQEHKQMEAWQFMSAVVGLSFVLIGVFVSSLKELPAWL